MNRLKGFKCQNTKKCGYVLLNKKKLAMFPKDTLRNYDWMS